MSEVKTTNGVQALCANAVLLSLMSEGGNVSCYCTFIILEAITSKIQHKV